MLEGDTIVAIGSIYGGSYARLKKDEKSGIRNVVWMSLEEFNTNGIPDNTKMVFFESCTNPTLETMPIFKISKAAKKVGAITVCDNTMGILSNFPKRFKTDLIIHSMTKYMNGKSEDLGGSVSGDADLINQFSDLDTGEKILSGAIMAPRVSAEFLENITDLPERIEKCFNNMLEVKKSIS